MGALKYKVGSEAIKEKRRKKVPPPIIPEKETIGRDKVLSPEIPIEGKTYSSEEVAKLLQDFTKKDPYSLKGLNPAYRYRFINRADEKLSRQTMRGWEIVTGEEAEKIAKETKIKTRTGQIIVGDGVLAKIPMDLYVSIRARLQELNRRTIGDSSKTLRRDMGSKHSRNVEESLSVRERGRPEEVVI